MSKTKIEWTDYTWNPVWGCKADCEYCYARSIAKRFAEPMAEKNGLWSIHNGKLMFPNNDAQLDNQEEIYRSLKEFKPVFLGANFEFGIDDFKLLKKNGFPKKNMRKIFIGSMSDIAFWEDEWIEKIVEKIKRYPLHTFQLLTKFPKIYKKLDKIMPSNVWFGITITSQNEMQKLKVFREMKFGRIRYISFEPLMTSINNEKIQKLYRSKFQKVQTRKYITYLDFVDWIIIGTMSGRKRTPAKMELVKNIVNEAKQNNISVFIKQLEINGKVEKDISKFPKDLQIREFPVW